MMVHKLRSGVN